MHKIQGQMMKIPSRALMCEWMDEVVEIDGLIKEYKLRLT